MPNVPVKPHSVASGRNDLTRAGMEIRPKGLNIIWGNDKRYWKPPVAEDDAAELIQVCWLEVSGVATVTVGGHYKIGFNVSLKPDSFGWSSCKPFVMAKVGKTGKYIYKAANLFPPTGGKFDVPNSEDLIVEVKPGDELHFGLYEIWSGRWKGGLEVHHAFIRPYELPPVT